MSETKTLKDSLDSKLSGVSLQWSEFRSQQRVTVPAAKISVALETLRDAGMDQLVDITAVDMLEYPGATDRFEVVYLLLNTNSGERLTVKTHVNEP
ncbi:MAG: NADH-quinone oxidoreductase subunit C, partial [Pirellula sp.]